MRPPKKLIDHVREGTFRPERHATLLLGEDLPLTRAAGDSEAARRVWDRMRRFQTEYRRGIGPDLLREIAIDFSRAANELLEISKRADGNHPDEVIAGLAELRMSYGDDDQAA